MNLRQKIFAQRGKGELGQPMFFFTSRPSLSLSKYKKLILSLTKDGFDQETCCNLAIAHIEQVGKDLQNRQNLEREKIICKQKKVMIKLEVEKLKRVQYVAECRIILEQERLEKELHRDSLTERERLQINQEERDKDQKIEHLLQNVNRFRDRKLARFAETRQANESNLQRKRRNAVQYSKTEMESIRRRIALITVKQSKSWKSEGDLLVK